MMSIQDGITRRQFLVRTALGAAGLAGLGPQRAFANLGSIGLATTDPAGESVAAVQAADSSRIRILQLTDIHFFSGHEAREPWRRQRTIDEMHRLVELTEPDVVAITGDLWHDNPDHRGTEFMAFSVEQCEALGVPWLFTWGNHDELDDYVHGHDTITNARHSLYRGGPEAGNYVVRITNQAGETVWDLICVNSANFGILGPQKAWLERLHARQQAEAGNTVPAFGLFHIPVHQYETIWQEGTASGFYREKVCFEQEDGSALPVLARLGRVRACFCGHDHVNDYFGPAEGIELVYGRATGHGGYGGDQVRKGAKLITANAETGNYAWESIFPDGYRWHPGPDMRIEETIDAPWMRVPVEESAES